MVVCTEITSKMAVFYSRRSLCLCLLRSNQKLDGHGKVQKAYCDRNLMAKALREVYSFWYALATGPDGKPRILRRSCLGLRVSM